MKKSVRAGTYLAPVPVVLVSCGREKEANLITLAWAGTVNSEPPIVSISIRYQRHSYKLVEESGEFTVNLVAKDMVRATDLCGIVSGKDTDKFGLSGLTPCAGERVSCPYVKESPLSLECKVIKKVEFPTHAVFFGEVVNAIADEKFLDEKGKPVLPPDLLAAYVNGKYVSTQETLGSYAYTAKELKK